MISVANFLCGVKNRPAWLAFLSAATLIVLLCVVFIPCWERNDDVAMSMIAHGYGLAAYGSPYLVFSNVLWGYVVRALPTINGVLGYSLATMAVLLVFGWSILYFLLRLGAGYLTSLFAVALLITLPTISPQFTVNAGLLTVAAVIGWQVYARLGGVGSLAVACLLAFMGYLIRGTEFLLVLGVALPLLPWRALRERRQMQIALLLLGVAIAAAAAFDRWSYSGPEWQNFKEFNSARIPFTDYYAGWHLKKHPEILARHGYSQNDVDLVGEWFFVDPQIADPKSLKAMVEELGPLFMQDGNIQTGFMAIKALFSPFMLPVLLSGLLLFVLIPHRLVAFSWMLYLAALFVMGLMGRPGALRVYIPLMSLLLLAPLIFGKCGEGIRRWMVALTLLTGCFGAAYLFMPMALQTKQWVQQIRSDMHGLPGEPIVNWGGNPFPLELAFPVLANDPNSHSVKLFGLDSFTHAPFSVASVEQAAGRGMPERLRTAAGLPIIASLKQMEMLRIYCGERLHGQQRSFVAIQTRSLTVQQVRCETDK